MEPSYSGAADACGVAPGPLVPPRRPALARDARGERGVGDQRNSDAKWFWNSGLAMKKSSTLIRKLWR